MDSVFSVTNAVMFESYGNTIKYCTYMANGIYYLKYVATITDEESTYENNTASSGGVYYVIGSTSKQSVAKFSYNTYEENYGSLGGIIAAYDNFDITFSHNDFSFNWASKGGIAYSTELSSGSENSTLYFYSNDFDYNEASSQGGIAFISHSLLNIYFEACSIINSYAPTGGVFYVSSVIIFDLYENSFEENYGTDGSIIYSTAAGAYFDFESNTFQGSNKYNYTGILSYMNS